MPALRKLNRNITSCRWRLLLLFCVPSTKGSCSQKAIDAMMQRRGRNKHNHFPTKRCTMLAGNNVDLILISVAKIISPYLCTALLLCRRLKARIPHLCCSRSNEPSSLPSVGDALDAWNLRETYLTDMSHQHVHHQGHSDFEITGAK